MSGVRQQINLYQPVAQVKHGSFSSVTAVRLIGGVVVCMLALWGYGLWTVKRLQASVSTLTQQQRQQQDAMTALSAARTLGISPEEIDTRVKELTAELAAHSGALDMLRNGAVGQTTGFSKRLTALARHSTGGVWIDRLFLSGTSGSMTLGGAALDPQTIPRYLHDLGTEAALSGIRFDQFVIEQPAKATAESADPARNAPIATVAPQAASAGKTERTFKFRAASNSTLMAGTREPAP